MRNEQDIEFHIIGTGGFENEFKEKVINEKLDNIKFFPWQDSSIINDVYSECDIELVPLSRGVIWTSFPSKCTLLMACGRTFLCMCEKESNFYNIVNSEKIGICVERTDYKEAANVIHRLKENKAEIVELASKAKEYGEAVYSSTYNAYKYVDIVKELVEENRNVSV